MNTEKLIMGYWDCPFCDTKGIEGIKRECPNCGKPRGEDTRFYMKKEKRYLTKEEGKDKGKGEDWLCDFCGSLNSTVTNVCTSCGAEREKTSRTYSDIKNEEQNKTTEAVTKAESKETSKIAKKKLLSTFGFLLLELALITCLISGIIFGIKALSPKTADFLVNSVGWQTSTDAEEYKTFHESDWSVPDGGRVTDSRREIYTYEQVLDHYETVTKSKTVSVLDHYETKYDYRNNGDGTFSESSYEVPVYKNEVQYYTQEEPVYRSEPVYRTKYYYDIDRWTVYDTLLEKGSKEDTIRYADVEISDTKRAGKKDVRYLCSMTFTNGKKKGQKCDFTISESIYESLNKGMTVKCRYLGNEILEIK